MIVTKRNFKPFNGTVFTDKYKDKLELTGFITRNDKIAQMLVAGEMRMLDEDRRNQEFIDEQRSLLKSRNIEDDVIVNHIKELISYHKEQFINSQNNNIVENSSDLSDSLQNIDSGDE